MAVGSATLGDLHPLGYHRRVAEHLETQEPDLWAWFHSDAFAEQYEREARLRLDKSAIRLGRDAKANAKNTRRYELAEKARDSLGLSAPITLYQSGDSAGAPNAMLHYIPGQITIEFVGRVLELLDEEELLDLLGHETAHYKLFEEEGGRYHTAARLIHWVCHRDDCPTPWFETARRLSLYTEVYCDTAGLIVTGNKDVVIRGLTKVIADFKDADAKTYLEQAEAVIAQEKGASKGITHPELYIRAKAISERDQLSGDAFDAALVPLIEGPLAVDGLDLIGQVALQELTRNLIDAYARPAANRTDAVMAHARMYFPKYRWPAKSAAAVFALPDVTQPTRDYLAYVMLDLATCDRARFDDGLATALVIAKETGLERAFQKVARQELKRTADELAKFERHGEKVLAGASDA